MLPLKDVNPTTRVPLVTVALVLACLGAWLFWQQEPERDQVQDLVFNLEFAAIPCELVEGRPLTEQEIQATFAQSGTGDECGVGSDSAPAAFPTKQVFLAAIASTFFHGSVLHIGGNLLFLWIFGNNIEDRLGHVRFAVFYLLAGAAALATHVALQPDSTIPVIGASGAVAGVMGAYLVWFPNAPVRTLVFLGFPVLVTLRAKWLLGIWFVTQFFTSPNSGVAWAAHVGGFVFGSVVGIVVRTSQAARHATMRRSSWETLDRRWDPTGGVGDRHEYRRLGRR